MEEEKKVKEAKTRTSITIDPAVLDAARKHCEAQNISVSSFIETAVSEALSRVPAVKALADALGA